MRLKQTYKDLSVNRWYVVWTDEDSKAWFVYVGEKLNPAEAKSRLLRLLKTEPYTPSEVHWVWRELEAM